MSIVCVVPTIRPERIEEFKLAWKPLFDKHSVALVTVWDGDSPRIQINEGELRTPSFFGIKDSDSNLFFRKTAAIRNLGFVVAAQTTAQFVLTMDDDVQPPSKGDPIQEHLNTLEKRVPLSWMNTAADDSPGLRGLPYGIRDQSPVMLSHGVWINIPDFDGETQLRLSNNGKNPERIPFTLPYYVGQVPKGCFMPISSMNCMIRKEALSYFYMAPMGPDTGYPDLNRFDDIWMGRELKKSFDNLGWAVYSGASVVTHTRASDPFKNFEQEKLGREWNEVYEDAGLQSSAQKKYMAIYQNRRLRFADLIRSTQRS